MKSLGLALSILVSSSTMASVFAAEKSSEWIRVFGLTVEQVGSPSMVDSFDGVSYKVDVFASTNIKSQKFYAVKTYLNLDDSLMTLSAMPRETFLERRKYLKLLDLASRHEWKPVVYDMIDNCDDQQVVKHIYHGGKTQTVVRNCSSNSGEVPEMSVSMRALIERLDDYTG